MEEPEPRALPGVEWLDLDISQETFIAIASARRVEMRVGKLILRFQDKQMKGLRELAARMKSLKAPYNNSFDLIRDVRPTAENSSMPTR